MPRSRYDNRIDENLYLVALPSIIPGAHRVASEGDAEMIFIDLSKDDQFAANYRFINPEMVLPTLIDGEGPPLRQSLAILEYLEEQYPERPLLPKDAHARANV